ncbi:PA14 domain-containing protein [Marinobacter sp. AL4B]|uniref:PA14 domain-containing protein n=1 Tax=Marinobacter sp. AL4B TaxID=2871173 RepID=UPI001CAA4BE1|nr:PA14 domain-containing protein [Marinobacter sp. AL4B]MBZ0333679.1 fibronectin type III domain-containing protein [Marinobacter sp. AL4B]
MSVYRVLSLGSAIIIISGCQSWQLGRLPPTAAVPDKITPGMVEVRYYDGISGTSLSNLGSSAQFPDNPNVTEELTELSIPSGRGDNYGSFVRGFILPPATGDYRFFMAADDNAEFALSTNDRPEDIRTIASIPGWTRVNEYGKYSSQASGIIPLDADKLYYFELRHKEGGGGDHFSVAWEGPGFAQSVIGSAYIASWAQTAETPSQSSGESYNLGYRVGFVDGQNGLAFNPQFPPLDQDKDGLYDNWEILNGLDPQDPNDGTSDPDGDFLVSADEFLIGTRENNPDTDEDGIPDGAEYAYDLDPLNNTDASEDMDGDGYSNLEEHFAGTSVNDANDTPAPAEPTAVSGFTAQYFEGSDFQRLVAVEVQDSVDFDWSRGQPRPDMPDDRFSVRWNGTFTAPNTSGTNQYRFTVRTNDGVRLYADGKLVIDDWTERPTTQYSYEHSLKAGEKLNLTIEYFEGTGSAVAEYSATNLTTGQALSTAETVSTLDNSGFSTQDTDGDQIPDTWELQHGLSPWISDANSVNNSEGLTNIQAYQSALDPFSLETAETPDSGSSSGGTDTGGSTPPPEVPEDPAINSLTLSWTAPLTRIDGSSIALSEIDSYTINYGQSTSNLDQTQQVSGDQTSYTFENLSLGTWYFTIQVTDTAGLSSPPSDVVSGDVK